MKLFLFVERSPFGDSPAKWAHNHVLLVFVFNGAETIATKLVFAWQYGWFEDEFVADEALKFFLMPSLHN